MKQWLLKTLTLLGLTEIDAEIYILLAREGPLKGRNVANALKLYKQQLYRSLKRLENSGLIRATLERPALFAAVPLEKILDVLIEEKKEQALALQEKREELLSRWRTIIERKGSPS